MTSPHVKGHFRASSLVRPTGLDREDKLFDTALNLLTQGLLTQLPAGLITAALTGFVAWAIGKRRNPGD